MSGSPTPRVRARFRLNSYETQLHTSYPMKEEENESGIKVRKRDFDNPIHQEMRTLNLTPVQDDSPETRAFWEATPSGHMQLGVVNQEAWAAFELGKDYYVDFTPVPEGE